MEKRRRRVPQSVSPTGVRCTARRLDGHFTQTILPHTPPRSRARLGVADLNGFSDGELRAQVAVASENAGPGVCSRIQDSSVTRECRLSGSAAKKPLPRTDRPTVLPRLRGMQSICCSVFYAVEYQIVIIISQIQSVQFLANGQSDCENAKCLRRLVAQKLKLLNPLPRIRWEQWDCL